MAAPRVRKAPEERRSEILEEAARIALDEGLERITLREVAERLGVRPGLIGHYFPVIGDLVNAAFALAVSRERDRLFVPSGSPVERLAGFVRRVESAEARSLGRLWLNARHLARFAPGLAAAIAQQERLDEERLTALIEAGVVAGDFRAEHPAAACVRIWMAVDGLGAYANSPAVFEAGAYSAYDGFVGDVCAWTLGLEPGGLEAAVVG
ncbi:TetR/AcrR family transcriptional regulator [Leucobacter luti]|uniref:TetR family transcriptional regulator n=1 Tax=Leucobacter luti TaxID=340320 RepID=A0A4R6S6Q9_9MICO|nr:TetR family transcriptional regulator [Leucobacter luti]QYM76651.1 TetR family transcriptional regulator [Leucobacter luti]TDP94475.1 TetR family transcriptional regulator [Leucobacter luti]